MTRSSLTARTATFTGTGSLDTYSFTFFIQLDTHLEVVEELISTGVQTTLVLTTDYTIPAASVENVNGGSWTLTAGNLPATKKIFARRKVPLTQITDIRNQGDFLPETHEDQFDKHNDIDQQQQDDLNLSLKLAATVDPSSFSTEIIGPLTVAFVPRINATLDGMEWAQLVSGSNISLPAGLQIMVQTATGVFTARSIVKVGNIVITNGDGQSGDMTIDSSAIDTSIATNVTNITTNVTAIALNTTLRTTDLGSTDNAKGASLVGVEDSAGKTTATDVEAWLVELQAAHVKSATGTFTSDGTNNRTISTGIASGSTILEILVTNRGQVLYSHWHAGDSSNHLGGAGSIAMNANATSNFTTSGVDFIVGASATNAGATAAGWIVYFKD